MWTYEFMKWKQHVFHIEITEQITQSHSRTLIGTYFAYNIQNICVNVIITPTYTNK